MGLQHESMSDVNEYLVLEHMTRVMRSSRSEIAESLGLSPASVSRVVSRLIARGILTETGETTTTGGRPRSVVAVDLESNCVIGIDLGGTKCHGVVADLAGQILDEEFLLVADANGGADALDRMWNLLTEQADKLGRRVSALAVGIPAVIDPQSDLAVRGPNIGWEGFDVKSRVGAFGVPFLIENDVNLAAIAEGEVGKATECSDFAVISIGTGLGSAIVANGKLVRGKHSSAGEVGYLPNPFQPPGAQARGDLESVLSGAGLADRARHILATHPEASDEFGAAPTGRLVLEAGLAGKPYSAPLVAALVSALEELIVGIVAVTDPEMVIVDGSIGRALGPLLGQVAAGVGSRLPSAPAIEISELGPYATVRGAVLAASGRFLDTFTPPILSLLRAEGSAL